METNKDIIKRVFLSMEYGEDMHSTEKALEWLKSKNYKLSYRGDKNDGEIVELYNKISTEKTVLCTVQKTIMTDDSGKQTISSGYQILLMMNKFADEIHKNIETVCQLEMLARGLLIKDTTKQTKLLGDYIKYYSSFGMKFKPDTDTRINTFFISIGENTGLSLIGAALGIGLAHGGPVVIQGPPLLAPVVTYLLELAQNSGVPEHSLQFYPLDSTKVPYIECNYFQVERFKIPMIIFDNADLDAACDSVIEAAWSHMGSLPETVGTLIVQENVFESFLNKLKNALKAARVGNAADSGADLAYPDKPTTDHLISEVEEAKKRGIEVFQADASSKTFQPTLFIGAAVHSNRVIDADARLSSGLAVVSFRNVDEAVDLANNSKQGFAASVWTENIGLANEVAGKLNVANVWLNGHGLFSVDVPMFLRKHSGWGVIGGEAGFSFNDVTGISPMKSKMNRSQLIDVFLKTANDIMENINSYIPKNKQQKLIDSIYECITKEVRQIGSKLISGHMVNSYSQPIGHLNFRNINFEEITPIVKAILEGNLVTVFEDNEDNKLILNEIFKHFPNNVITIETLARKDIHNKFFNINLEPTCMKNVWLNVGSSSQYKM